VCSYDGTLDSLLVMIVYLQAASFYRVAYDGCYPNVQEFVDCATNDEPPSENDLYNTRIMFMEKAKMHFEQVTLNCRETCKEIAAATSRYIHHVRVNYEGEVGH